ncbi:DNA helicase RecQ [Schlesneria sp.]|uniref:DNA helicase RecQ n=1 Tax=Schlesneria sp. TaxID=2762018 RepID=UPI002EFE0972
MANATDVMSALRDVLQKYWGYDSFRPLQAEAMRTIIERRDSVVVLPTGGGKSICFQAPAVAMPGLAVVVSPLISLMKDQVDALTEYGIPAACVNSSMTNAERFKVADSIRRGELKLLYVAPERLCSDKMLDFLETSQVSFFAIDEAHCISAWGHDFRPEYRMLQQLRTRFPGIGVHAFTATATETVRQDISDQLGLRDPEWLIGSFDRPNLIYRVLKKGDVLKQVRSVIDAHPEESGIVYCISRREVDELAQSLKQAGYKTRPYHAGLSDADRNRHQDEFLNDKTQIIVATVAFGMGIDKSNVRYVIHTGAPKSLEHYQQETGRAGRDGLEAECWLLWSSANFIIWRKMQEELPPPAKAQALESLKGIERFCTGVSCRHKVLVEHFNQAFESFNCRACDVCLDQLDLVADPLVMGQKILSCVVRVNESYGADYVAQVLVGSRDARILANEHDQLSTYGLLKSERKEAVRDWIEQLASQGFLEREGEYNTLKVTDAGWKLLKGQATLKLLQPAKKKSGSGSGSSSKVEAASWEGVDRELFDELRGLRRRIAEGHGVAPFVIFADTTLRDLARRRPTNLANFRLVHGVGDKKTADFGSLFTDAIREYCDRHQVARDLDTPGSTTLVPRVTQSTEAVTLSPTKQLAFDLFRQGKSVEDVAALTERTSSTVSDYLIEFIGTIQQCDPAPWVNESTFEKVRAAVARVGTDRLRPIFEALDQQVQYGQIKVALACIKNLPPVK